MLIGVPDARPRALAFLPESLKVAAPMPQDRAHPWRPARSLTHTTYYVSAYWHELKTGGIPVAAYGAMAFPGFPIGLSYLDLIQAASLSDDDHGALELAGARKLGMSKPWGNNSTFEWAERSFYDEGELQQMLIDPQYRPTGSDAWYMYRRPRY